MTNKDLLTEYVSGKRDAISTIRHLSGMFDPANATDILFLVCYITRIEQGDALKEEMSDIYGLKDSE